MSFLPPRESEHDPQDRQPWTSQATLAMTRLSLESHKVHSPWRSKIWSETVSGILDPTWPRRRRKAYLQWRTSSAPFYWPWVTHSSFSSNSGQIVSNGVIYLFVVPRASGMLD
jgi:hypothetical protein